jgi:hypothetical protein
MNYAYVGLLCLALCLLFDAYSADTGAKVLLVANVMVSIATLKYAAYYPVLIDVGAGAVLTLAMYSIVAGRRIPTALACVAAVLAREFAIAVLAFGVVRDLRGRVPLWTIILTYAPAAAAFVAWRTLVAATIGSDGMVSIPRMLSNLEQWVDPAFAGFFVYFLLTVFGGVSLFVVARCGLAMRHLRREPEWAVFILAVITPSLLGNADIWRYLAYLLPAFAVFFAICARDLGLPRRRLVTAAILCAATVITQRPLQALDLPAYFRDWFPYYVHLGRVPSEAMDPEIWPVWAWRFLIAAAFCWLLAAFPALTELTTDADRA